MNKVDGISSVVDCVSSHLMHGLLFMISITELSGPDTIYRTPSYRWNNAELCKSTLIFKDYNLFRIPPTCFQIAGKMSQLSDSTSLILLRLDFIRIICSHEHYFPLNLPFATPLTPSGTSSPTPSSGSAISHHSFASNTSTSTLTDKGVYLELTPEFRQQHFLVGLVLSDLSAAFDTL